MVVAVYIKGFLYTDIFIANGYWATIDILVNHFTMNGHAIESIEYHIIPASQTQGFDDVICAEVGEDQVGEAGHGLECHKSAVCQHCPHTVLTLMAEMMLQGATISVWPQLLESTPNPSRSRFRYWRPVKC